MLSKKYEKKNFPETSKTVAKSIWNDSKSPPKIIQKILQKSQQKLSKKIQNLKNTTTNPGFVST